MRIGEVVLQRGTRKRDHLRDAILPNVRGECVRVVARDDGYRFAAALLCELEAGMNRSQCGFRKVTELVLGKNQYVTHDFVDLSFYYSLDSALLRLASGCAARPFGPRSRIR